MVLEAAPQKLRVYGNALLFAGFQHSSGFNYNMYIVR